MNRAKKEWRRRRSRRASENMKPGGMLKRLLETVKGTV